MALVEPADDEAHADGGDQRGADVTARLLLALTALFVQRSNHTAEEQRQYTELALGLIDNAGPAARADVAARLLHHPDAPAAVIARLDDARLAHDRPDGASPLHSTRNQHAEGRPAPDRSGETYPRSENEPYVGEPAREESGSSLASVAGQPRASLAPELADTFFALASPERRGMLSMIAAADAGEAAPGNGRRFHVRIDTAPWQGRTGAFARDFARLIDAPESLCERILNDPSGEPLVVAARATGMPVAILQRILLLVCPATNHSVQRVYDLTELYHSLDGGAARTLLAAWRDAARADGNAPPQAAAPVTNLRARLGALNARIERQADRGSGASSVRSAPLAEEGAGP